MDSIALFEEKIPLTPRDLARDSVDINGILLKKLMTKLEGRCSLHGWVKPNSLQIISRSLGYVEKGRFTGDIVYHIQCEAKVYNPPSGIIVEGDVIRKNKMGMYVNYDDAIRIILPRDLHIGDEAYDSINIGDRVSVEIKKSRFQVNDEFILSVGLFRGKEGADYEREPNSLDREVEVAEEEKKEEPEAQPEVEPEVEPEAQPEVEPEAQPEVEPEVTTDPMAPIEFTSKLPAYREFSNFYGAPFTLDGKTWPSVEHYFQAMKFASDPAYQEQIRTAKTGAASKTLGSVRDRPIRQDWDAVRDDVMRKALAAKFEQNPSLKKMLIDTGNRPLVEANPTDSYWGYGRNKKGKNRLGALLMELRTRLQAEVGAETEEE
jgi:ribA/ribD-fused uncharacterized protein